MPGGCRARRGCWGGLRHSATSLPNSPWALAPPRHFHVLEGTGVAPAGCVTLAGWAAVVRQSPENQPGRATGEKAAAQRPGKPNCCECREHPAFNAPARHHSAKSETLSHHGADP